MLLYKKLLFMTSGTTLVAVSLIMYLVNHFRLQNPIVDALLVGFPPFIEVNTLRALRRIHFCACAFNVCRVGVSLIVLLLVYVGCCVLNAGDRPFGCVVVQKRTARLAVYKHAALFASSPVRWLLPVG